MKQCEQSAKIPKRIQKKPHPTPSPPSMHQMMHQMMPFQINNNPVQTPTAAQYMRLKSNQSGGLLSNGDKGDKVDRSDRGDVNYLLWSSDWLITEVRSALRFLLSVAVERVTFFFRESSSSLSIPEQ